MSLQTPSIMNRFHTPQPTLTDEPFSENSSFSVHANDNGFFSLRLTFAYIYTPSMGTTAATISIAISSGGGLFHAEYVVVVEGGLAWTALGGFSAVQINVDLVDWDAFFYGAWVGAAVDVFLRTVNPATQLGAGPTKQRVDGGITAPGTASLDSAGRLSVRWQSAQGAQCVLLVKVPATARPRAVRRGTRRRLDGDARLLLFGAMLAVELEAQRARVAAWSAAAALSRAVWWAPHVRRALEARARFEEAEHLEMWWWCVAFG